MAKKQFLDGPTIEAHVATVAKGLPGWGMALRALRKENNLTASRLAQLIGGGESTIHGWERDKTRPKAGTLRNLLIALNTDPNLVRKHLGEEEAPPTSLGVLSINAHPKIAVSEILASLPDANPEEIESALYERLVIPTIAAQAVRALQGDTKAAAFLLSRADSIRRSKRYQKPPMAAKEGEGNFYPVKAVEHIGPVQCRDED